MPYSIHCTTTSKKSISTVFKLRRSWEAINCAQPFLGNDPISLPDEGSLHQASGLETLEGYSSDLSETESMHSEDSTELEIQKPRDGSPTYIVSHPWEVVDYHLYLCSVEGGKDTHTRRNGMLVYDGIDCRPVYYSELLEGGFERCNIGEIPRFLFWDLPIADLGPSFNGRHYVLGFDYNSRTLFARHFDWIPDKTDDLWCVWDLGFTMYSVTIPDLVILLDSGLSEDMHVGLGLLSSSPYCIAMGSNDDPGMEIVITILFCQWILDFAEAFFEQDVNTLDIFKRRIAHYMEECRVILARASYRAWFALRDGYRKAACQRNSFIDKFTSDLFTFSKSIESGSLKNQSWRAPSLETCNLLRHKDRVQRRAKTEQRLESLFTIPDNYTPPGRPQEVLERMVIKTKESLAAFRPAETHRTRPSCQYESFPLHPWSSMSSKTLKFKDEELEVTEHHGIPLSLLLKRIMDLIETRPELDSPENRACFGELLNELGLGVKQRSMDDPSVPPKLGSGNDSLKLEVYSMIQPKALLTHHLRSRLALD
ncbi:hypothetical protein BDV23DRAFT_148296 [Aspergillus alliaceus]|uniref:Uncharacterized protein n=1 Tax=Petromyces alliaceus TaxID=209559 RepID=A0A5N6FKX2_PETAA|nr:uncharacterized protein BDW43DRAFT_288607 [Aspergillus alliaceus]KAB8229304.1 hypothetical protein BDW43DRAFT_288607 [Aspergillus alliaceus]KAE8393944.1 hypothetical protein BDV23DRAFT_148296 [Aspergillus alliaceus]